MAAGALDAPSGDVHDAIMSDRPWPQRVTYDISRLAARLAGISLFQLRAGGRNWFPDQGGGLVCSNHQSFLDPVLVGTICDRRLNYLARENLFHSPWFGPLIRWYDAIPIRRDGLGLAGLRETLKRLKAGELVLIFPEGTRTYDGQVQPLKPGFCALARRGGVPLVPVGIDGAFQVWPRSCKLPCWGPISLYVGPPIWPTEIARLSDQELVQVLHGRLVRCHRCACRLRSRTSWGGSPPENVGEKTGTGSVFPSGRES